MAVKGLRSRAKTRRRAQGPKRRKFQLSSFAAKQLRARCLKRPLHGQIALRRTRRSWLAIMLSPMAGERADAMTDEPINLDQHRGMAAQKATDLRRLMAEVVANERSLRHRQDELETRLVAAPAASWHEAADKARYLLNLFAATPAAQDPRRQKLIEAVLADFERLSNES
jgi:hypothetical protein